MASWTRGNWRKTDGASVIGPIPALKIGDLSVIWTRVPVSLSPAHDNRTPYAIEVAGGSRNSAMSRRRRKCAAPYCP